MEDIPAALRASCKKIQNGLGVRGRTHWFAVVSTYGLPREKRLDLFLFTTTLSEYVAVAWNPGRLGKLLSKDGGNG